jgi:hypothetical protein
MCFCDTPDVSTFPLDRDQILVYLATRFSNKPRPFRTHSPCSCYPEDVQCLSLPPPNFSASDGKRRQNAARLHMIERELLWIRLLQRSVSGHFPSWFDNWSCRSVTWPGPSRAVEALFIDDQIRHARLSLPSAAMMEDGVRCSRLRPAVHDGASSSVVAQVSKSCVQKSDLGVNASGPQHPDGRSSWKWLT